MNIFSSIFSFLVFISTANGRLSFPYDIFHLINDPESFGDNLTQIEEQKPLPNFRHRRLEPLDQLICKHLGCSNATFRALHSKIVTKFPTRSSTQIPISQHPARSNSVDDRFTDNRRSYKNREYDRENGKVYDGDKVHQYVLRTNDYAVTGKPRRFVYDQSYRNPVTHEPEVVLHTNKPTEAPTTTTKKVEKDVKEMNSTSLMTYEENQFKMHTSKMLRDAVCEVPTPIIVRVADLYPDKHKRYLPPCTKLYRCSHMSGCCSGRSQCVPRTTQTISLYFKVTRYFAPENRSSIHRISSYESLLFSNDTSCKCSSRENEDDGSITNEDPPYEEHDENFNMINYGECKCARPFSPSINFGKCVCDCNQDLLCLKYKKGLVIFNDAARACLTEGKCTQPQCDYGNYEGYLGRCPFKVPGDPTSPNTR